MDWGVITGVVAAIFGLVGIVIGVVLSKAFNGKDKEEKRYDFVKLEGLSERLEKTLSSIEEKVSQLTEKNLSSLQEELKYLLSILEDLKGELDRLDVTDGSRKAIEDSISLLKNFKLSLPEFDSSVLTQIKDNLLIIRNDLNSLMLQNKEKKEENCNLEEFLSSVESAINLAKEVNVSLLKSELSVLAKSFKEEELKEILKELDRQTLSAKELVVLLNSLKKELEGVRK